MHSRRLATFVAGFWLALSVAMFFVATQNFRGVNRVLVSSSAEAAKQMDHLGREPSRMLLRYQVSELNRYYFEWYSVIQIFIAMLFAATLLFATNGSKWVLSFSLLLVGVALFENFLLVPEMTFLGRAIDFVPADVPAPARSRFWSFHSAYSASEVVKLLILVGLSLKMLVITEGRRSRPRTAALEEELTSQR